MHSPLETNVDILPTTYQNYGIVRHNWDPSAAAGVLTLVAGAAQSDSAEKIVSAICRLGLSTEETPASADALEPWLKAKGSAFEDSRFVAALTPKPRHLKLMENAGIPTRLIVVFDDPCSLALSAEGESSKSIVQLLHEKTGELEQLSLLAAKARIPNMLISAAKARIRPDVTASTLSDFIGLDASDAQLRSAQHFIDDRAPLEQNLFNQGLGVQGALNRVQQPGKIAGWVRIPLSEERLYVLIKENGVPVADGLAQDYRHDLDANNIGDGKYGFSISVNTNLSLGEREFEVVVPQYDFHVGRIQMSGTLVSVLPDEPAPQSSSLIPATPS